MDTHVYIDGFNLYYGLLRGTPYKWLDLERFCDRLLSKNTVCKIYYFTAKVDARPHDPGQPARQQAYLSALAVLPRVELHLGTFMTSVISQVVVDTDPKTGRYLRHGGKPVLKLDAEGTPEKAWVYKSEEKGSDVNLAAHLLRDAYRGSCQCAVIVSNDSDLLTPIRMAKSDCGIDPRMQLLAASQLPDPIETLGGLIRKPASW